MQVKMLRPHRTRHGDSSNIGPDFLSWLRALGLFVLVELFSLPKTRYVIPVSVPPSNVCGIYKNIYSNFSVISKPDFESEDTQLHLLHAPSPGGRPSQFSLSLYPGTLIAQDYFQSWHPMNPSGQNTSAFPLPDQVLKSPD